MRRALISLLAAALLSSAAAAQTVSNRPTYWAGVYNLAAAATPTDVVCLENPTGAVVRLLGVSIYGVGGAAGTINLSLVRRTTLNTGGTSTTPTIALSESVHSRPPTAVFRAYTANPTALGTAGGTFRQLRWDVTTNGSNADPTGSALLNFAQAAPLGLPPTLRSVGSAFCVNLNSTAVAATVTIDMAWTEE